LLVLAEALTAEGRHAAVLVSCETGRAFADAPGAAVLVRSSSSSARSTRSWVTREIKARRPGRPDPLSEGLLELDAYLGPLGIDTGWLIIFDRRPEAPAIEARTTASEVTSPAGRHVTVIRG
jgi:hypothetical protein